MNNEQLIKYPAVFDPAEEGGYNVSFPDFPGCVTFGKTFEEAQINAQEVLELWLEELAHEGEPIVSHDVRPIITEIVATIPSGVEVHHYAAINR